MSAGVLMGAEDSAILHLDESHVVLHSDLDVSPFENDNRAPLYDVEATGAHAYNYSGSSTANANDEDVPTAYAELSEPLLQSPEASLMHNYTLHIATADAQPVGYNRPEFIFAKVIKPSIHASCGLFLKCSKGTVIISRISEKGLFSKSNLRPGDRVISVNGISCRTAVKFAALIHAAPTFVAIVLHNREGDPRLVSTSIPKPTRGTKVGVSLKNYRGAIHVGRVDTSGLFAESLLTPGQRCITINDVNCSLLRATDAANVVANAEDIVTIVSEPRQEWAMVLSCGNEQQKSWWRRSAIAATTGLAGAITVGVLAAMH
jgi:predicted metalloprotease with PDZ domain